MTRGHQQYPNLRLLPWKTYLRWLCQQPMVRPWALSAPIAVLLICLPLMRPLRHPDPRMISDDEQGRLATVQAIVERHTLAIDHIAVRSTRAVIIKADGHWYSDESPVMSTLLAGPYWVMHRFGLSFDSNAVLTEYLLTLLGVTLPVAFAAGLLYRMGRLFELRRPLRAFLALFVVIGSGWISYATVLNAGAAAAALVVMAAGCLVQATLTRHRHAALAWAFAAGLLASLAATYEFTAAVFLLLLIAIVPVLNWPGMLRIGSIGCYLAGALIPLALYAGLNRAVTGDLKPGFLHAELRPVYATAAPAPDGDDDPPTFWPSVANGIGRVVTALVGNHGVLTHFPVLLVGLIGVSMVMHRHWPPATKVFAAATVVGAATILLAYALMRPGWRDPMFANRWFLVFLPLTLFWGGAWLRRPHRPGSWAVAAVLLCFSTGVALLGATDPQPPQGYDTYTAKGAWDNLVYPQAISERTTLVAGR
jgi:hypothetical protein